MSKMPLPTKKHMRSSFRDAVYTNLNVGMVDNYFGAFLLALGMSEVTTGMGIVIPQFIGVTFQLLSIRSFFTKYSLKSRLVLFLSFQALALVPIIIAGSFKINSPWFVIPFLGLYWASLMSLNPPWNRLIGNTVPGKFRLKFFSIRNQFSQFAIFLGMIIMGVLLHSRAQDDVLPIFVGIFCLGFVLKCLSAYEIKVHHNDVELKEGIEQRLKFRDFIKRIKGTEQGKLTLFLFLFYICVHFSSPYFGPYMLKKLQFSYLQFMMITACSYFGRVVMFRILQKKARLRQVDTLLLISTVGISLSPLYWTFSQNYLWIMGIEFISGCSWAGFELATTLIFFQKIDDRERTSVLTYIAFLNTTGMLLGSSLGALFMKNLPSNSEIYLLLFISSTLLRLTLVLFSPQINLKEQLSKFRHQQFGGEILGMKKKKKSESEKNKIA